MSTDAHFWVKIGFKFQSLGKISKISAADPPSSFRSIPTLWTLVIKQCHSSCQTLSSGLLVMWPAVSSALILSLLLWSTVSDISLPLSSSAWCVSSGDAVDDSGCSVLNVLYIAKAYNTPTSNVCEHCSTQLESRLIIKTFKNLRQPQDPQILSRDQDQAVVRSWNLTL